MSFVRSFCFLGFSFFFDGGGRQVVSSVSPQFAKKRCPKFGACARACALA